MSEDDLNERLQVIDGIGPAKSDEIMEIINEYAATEQDDTVDGAAVLHELQLGRDHLARAGYERSADLSRTMEAIVEAIEMLRPAEGEEAAEVEA